MNTDTPSKTPGRPKDSAKRQEIVVAATQLFMDKGYELTSMEAVAKEAGVSKLTIYSHFADKQELFRAIMQNRCDRIGMPVSLLDHAQLPVEEALLSIARLAMAKIYRADSIRLIRVIQSEILHRPEIAQIYYEVGPSRVRAAFADLLTEFTRLGKLNVADATRASEQFFSLLKGEMMQRAIMAITPLPEPDAIEQQISTTIDLFLAAYKPSAKV